MKRKQLTLFTQVLICLCNSGSGDVQLFKSLSKDQLKQQLQCLGISNQKAFYLDVHASIHEGSRLEFTRLTNILATMPSMERSKYIHSIVDDETFKHKLMIANEYMWRLPEAGIAAYDYTWLIYKYWIGYILGYNSVKALRNYSDTYIPILQQSYSSWKELMIAYYAGSAFNGKTISLDSKNKCQSSLATLLTSIESVIHKIDFHYK